MGVIWSIILAAGESRRMGSPKMLLPFNGTTMIESVVKNVTGSDTDHTIVVLGAYSDSIIGLISNMDVTICYNDHYKDGMLSSVQCGFRNLPQEIDAVLVFQGDQPLITPEVINSLIRVYRQSVKGLVIPVCNNMRGHPLLVDKKYIGVIEQLDRNDGLRSLSVLYSDDVLEVETDDPGILRDFNTYEEYTREINLIK